MSDMSVLCAACPHRCPHENVSSQATLGELTLTALDGAGIAPSVDMVMAWLIDSEAPGATVESRYALSCGPRVRLRSRDHRVRYFACCMWVGPPSVGTSSRPREAQELSSALLLRRSIVRRITCVGRRAVRRWRSCRFLWELQATPRRGMPSPSGASAQVVPRARHRRHLCGRQSKVWSSRASSTRTSTAVHRRKVGIARLGL